MRPPITHMMYVDEKAAGRAVAVYNNAIDPKRCKMGGQCMAIQEAPIEDKSREKPAKLAWDNWSGLCPQCYRLWPDKANKEKHIHSSSGTTRRKGVCTKRNHDLNVVGRTPGNRCAACQEIEKANKAKEKVAENIRLWGLRSLWYQSGLPWPDLAKLCQVSKQRLEKYGSPSNPYKCPVDDARKIAKGLGCALGRLVTLEELKGSAAVEEEEAV